jgi:hypothetical protein
MKQTGERMSASLSHLRSQPMPSLDLPAAPEEAAVGTVPIEASAIKTVVYRCRCKSIKVKPGSLLSITLKREWVTKPSINSHTPTAARIWSDNFNERPNAIPTGNT